MYAQGSYIIGRFDSTLDKTTHNAKDKYITIIDTY